jgi:hypothetical protein
VNQDHPLNPLDLPQRHAHQSDQILAQVHSLDIYLLVNPTNKLSEKPYPEMVSQLPVPTGQPTQGPNQPELIYSPT